MNSPNDEVFSQEQQKSFLEGISRNLTPSPRGVSAGWDQLAQPISRCF
jgi:hypothetical protein